MADNEYIVSIILRARSELAGTLAKAKAEIEGFQRSINDGIGKSLGDGMDNARKSVDDTVKSTKELNREIDHTSTTANNAGRSIKTFNDLIKEFMRAEREHSSKVADDFDNTKRRADEMSTRVKAMKRDLDDATIALGRMDKESKTFETQKEKVIQLRREWQSAKSDLDRVNIALERQDHWLQGGESSGRIAKMWRDARVEAERYTKAVHENDPERSGAAVARLRELNSQLRRAGAPDVSNRFTEIFRDVEERHSEMLRRMTRREENHDVIPRTWLQRMQDFSRGTDGASHSVAGLDNQLRGLMVLGVAVFANQLQSALQGLVGGLSAVAGSAGMAAVALGGGLAAGITQSLPIIGGMALALLRLKSVFDALQQSSLVQEQLFARKQKDDDQSAKSTSAVANAHDSLNAALQNVKSTQDRVADAQENLTRVRADGRRELEDLILAEREAELAARGAAIAQKDAQDALRQALSQGRTGEIEQARLRVDESNLNRRQSDVRLDRARQDKRRIGGNIENLDSVKQAREQVESAKESAEDAARSVERARRGLKQAADDAKGSAQDAFAAQSKLDYMLKNMTDAERALYRSAKRIMDLWRDSSSGLSQITDIVIKGFTHISDRIYEILTNNKFVNAAKHLATQVTDNMTRLFDAFTSDKMLDKWFILMRRAGDNLKPITNGLIDLGKAWMNIAIAAEPVLDFVIDALRQVARDMLNWSRDTDKVNAFFREGRTHLKAWWDLARATFDLFTTWIGGGGTREGLDLVRDLTDTIERADKRLENSRDALSKWWDDSSRVTRALGRLLSEIGKALFVNFDPKGVELLVDLIVDTFLPALRNTSFLFGNLVKGFAWLVDNVPLLSPVLRLFITFLLLVKTFTTLNVAIRAMVGLMSTGGKAVGGMIAYIRALPGGIGAASAAWRVYTEQANAAAIANQRVAQTARAAGPPVRPGATSPGGVHYPPGYDRMPPPQPGTGVGGRPPAGYGRRFGPGAAAGLLGIGGASLGGLFGIATGQNKNAGDVAQNFLSGATFGIIPSAAQKNEQLAAQMKKNIEDTRKNFQGLVQAGDQATFMKSRKAFEELAKMSGSIKLFDPKDVEKFEKEMAKMQRALGIVRNTVSRGGFRINAWDIIDPKASDDLINNLEYMRDSGVNNIKDLRKRMQENVDYISKAFQEGSQGWANAMTRNFGAGIEAVRKGMRDGTISVKDGMDQIEKITNKQMRFARNHMSEMSDDGRAQLANNMDSAMQAVRKAMKRGEISTKEGMEKIRKLMAVELRSLGLSEKDIDLRQHQLETSAEGGTTQYTIGHGQAIGGWLGKQGEREKDGTAGTLKGSPVGRGEAVLNWAHQKVVEPALNAMYGFGLDGVFKATRGWHAGGWGSRGFAQGGWLQGAKPPSGPGSGPILALARKLFAMGFNATSGGEYRGSGTYHDQQKAIDWGNSANNMQKLWSVVYPMRAQLAELFGPSSTRPGPHLWKFGKSFSDGGLQAQHEDHIHTAVTEAISGAMGAGRNTPLGKPAKIKRVIAEGLHGQIKQAAQAALDNARKGVNKRLSQLSGGVAGAGAYHGPLDRVFPRHSAGEGGVTLSPGQVYGLAQKAGLPARAFEQIAHGESNYQPGVVSFDGGYGLWQMTPRVWGSTAISAMNKLGGLRQMLNPWKNALMAKWLYDRGGLSPWYGTRYLTASARAEASSGRAVGGFLQSFQDGGVIPGALGQAKLVLAHAGEFIMNVDQQRSLARALGVSIQEFHRIMKRRNGRNDLESSGKPDYGAKFVPGTEDYKRNEQISKGNYELPDILPITPANIIDEIKKLFKAFRNMDRKAKDYVDNVVEEIQNLTNEGGLLDQLSQAVERKGTRREIARSLGDFRRGQRRVRFNNRSFAILRDRDSTVDDLEEQLIDLVRNSRDLHRLRDQIAKGQRKVNNTMRDVNREIRKLERGGVDKDEEDEYKKWVKRQQDLIAQRRNLRDRMDEADSQIGANLAARFQAQVDLFNARTEQQLHGTTGRQARLSSQIQRAQTLGHTGRVENLNEAMMEELNKQRDIIRKRVREARRRGYTDEARDLQGQLNDLNSSIVDLTNTMLQNAIDKVNTEADRIDKGLDLSDRRSDLRSRMGDHVGAARDRLSTLTDRGINIGSRISNLSILRDEAIAEGNSGLASELTDQIDELNVQLEENTAAQKDATIAIRQTMVDDLIHRGEFGGGVFSGLSQIVQTIGSITGSVDTSALIGLTQKSGNLLRNTGTGLLQNLFEQYGIDLRGKSGMNLVSGISGLDFDSITEGMSDADRQLFENLINQIISNENALQQNTQQLKDLNGQMPALQQFSSTAWQAFRIAVFNGTGGLMPQFAPYIPTQANPIPTYPTAPSPSSSSSSSAPGNVNLYITNPTETADPTYIGKRLMWEMSTSGANAQ